MDDIQVDYNVVLNKLQIIQGETAGNLAKMSAAFDQIMLEKVNMEKQVKLLQDKLTENEEFQVQQQMQLDQGLSRIAALEIEIKKKDSQISAASAFVLNMEKESEVRASAMGGVMARAADGIDGPHVQRSEHPQQENRDFDVTYHGMDDSDSE